MDIDDVYKDLAILNKNYNTLKLKNNIIDNQIKLYDNLLNKMLYEYHKSLTVYNN